MAKYIAVTNAGERMAGSPVAGYAADAGWRIWRVRTILAPSTNCRCASPRRPSPAVIMNVPTLLRIARRSLLVAIVCVPGVLRAQGAAPGPLQEAGRLDVQGATAEARALIQRVIDSSSAPLGRSAAQRAMAISFAFDGDCANAVRYEEMVIAFWKTRESSEPQNAFYQQGEMANEAARICIDAGQFDIAERYYRLGSALGLAEPEPKTHPASLWAFRTAHALARLAARRGNVAEAQRQVAEARRILDGNPKMAAAQDRFFPYLSGYVALYSDSLATAEAELSKALALAGNQGDPFMHMLLAMTYEKLDQRDKAHALYEKAYSLATAHNPPSAAARPQARRKLKP